MLRLRSCLSALFVGGLQSAVVIYLGSTIKTFAVKLLHAGMLLTAPFFQKISWSWAKQNAGARKRNNPSTTCVEFEKGIYWWNTAQQMLCEFVQTIAEEGIVWCCLGWTAKKCGWNKYFENTPQIVCNVCVRKIKFRISIQTLCNRWKREHWWRGWF